MAYLSEEAIEWALKTLHGAHDFFNKTKGKQNADHLLQLIYTKLAGISPVKKFYLKNSGGENLKHWMNLVYTSGPEESEEFAKQKGFSYFNPLLESPAVGLQLGASCNFYLTSRLQSNVQVQKHPMFIAGTDEDGGEWVRLNNEEYVIGASQYLEGSKINLLALSIWYNRFFEVDEYITPQLLVDDFSKVLNVESIELEIFSNDVGDFPEIELTSDVRCLPSQIREFINWEIDEQSTLQKAKLDNWLEQNRDTEVGHPMYGPDYRYESQMSYVEENQISKEDFIQLLEERNQIIFYGPPGTSKTFTARAFLEGFADEDNIKLHPFHQSTTYEGFIGGYVFGAEGTPQFENGILWNMIDAAKSDSEVKHVLLIDEINRGNVSKILGECFTALDRDEDYEVLANRIEGEEKTPSKRPMHIPENLYIIGTMNTSDLSLTKIDDALRRRFAFVRMLPSSLTLRTLTSDILLENGVITKLFDFINIRIEEFLGSSGQKIGHAVFMPKHLKGDDLFEWSNWSQLRLFFNYTLYPLIESKSLGRPEIMYNILEDLNRIFDDDSSFEDSIYSVLYNRGKNDEED